MEKMRFDEFAKEVVEKIREYLPETFADARVELQTVTKNNDLKLTGLTIRSVETALCPTIYLEQFYDAYQSGADICTLLTQIADLRLRNDVKNNFDIEQITDFAKVKEHIFPRLVKKDWNEDLLKDRPYAMAADLAVTYHIQLDRYVSTAVTSSLMGTWGVNTQELHQIALDNMLAQTPSTFRPMSKTLERMFMGETAGGGEEDIQLLNPEDEALYVLSNKLGCFGAAALLDKSIMKAILDKFGEDFYILPSSVHEVLIVTAAPDLDVDLLADMVKSVNESEVSPEERLSDRVYRYTVKRGLQVARKA